MALPKVRFLLSAVGPSDFPRDAMPEIAFAGRSNVGKSSLINGLLGVKNLARTSSTPGRTRVINFFEVDGKMRWVDLPGYGYAAVSRQMSEGWKVLVEQYLLQQESLVLVLVLVDPRHGPTTSDGELIRWLQHQQLSFAVVLTKVDKIKAGRLGKAQQRCRDEYGVPEDRLFSYTTKKARNPSLWGFLCEMAQKGAANPGGRACPE